MKDNKKARKKNLKQDVKKQIKEGKVKIEFLILT